MVDRDLVASKLGELATHLARVRSRRTATADDLSRDRDALDLVAFNLMLAVQACADVASHVIADEGWPRRRPSGRGSSASGTRASSPGSSASRSYARSGFGTSSRTGMPECDPRWFTPPLPSGVADLDVFAREVAAWMQRQV